MNVRSIPFCVVSLLLFGTADDAYAIAFKCHNQTSLKFRVRVHDRGEWQPWAEMPPGYWGAPAKDVERAEHDMEIEVWTKEKGTDDYAWILFYSGRHPSRAFTRVIHLYQDQPDRFLMTWYDQPPGCRGKPTWNGKKILDECLTRSGWTDELLKKLVKEGGVDIAKTTFKRIVAGA